MTDNNLALVQAVTKLEKYEDHDYPALIAAISIVTAEINRIGTEQSKLLETEIARVKRERSMPSPDEIEAIKRSILTDAKVRQYYNEVLDPAIDYLENNVLGYPKRKSTKH